MYTIGQVATMTHLPVSTLRYYDKMGLLRELNRVSGIRQFSDQQLNALRLIECLKHSGLEIKEIKQFMDWCAEGPATYEKRRALFDTQLEKIDEKIAELERTRAMIEYKRWYYEQACEVGDESFTEHLDEIMPPDIAHYYRVAHEV